MQHDVIIAIILPKGRCMGALAERERRKEKLTGLSPPPESLRIAL